jgi:asparagine synthase (glutamine-hydrolysing)
VSIQAGVWNLDDEPADVQLLERVSQTATQYGPDGHHLYVKGSLGMLYRPFHTTKESCLEEQPYLTPGNNLITWDGRLDNRNELIPLLDGYLTHDQTDVAIVGAAFDKWGTDCFAKLLGDWAVAIWSLGERTLILAKDFMGIRHLYYQQTPKRVFWCTTLEPIVLLTNARRQINGEFVVGYLGSYPPAHVTPYIGIDAIPPCTYVTIKRDERKISRYWQFDPNKEIRHRTDTEYEQHFRELFEKSLKRRLRSHAPVIAELSGGVDSTSIVCVADLLILRGEAETPRLDTMSYYDDEEPNWNERPYFHKVEQKRGRTGCHISMVPPRPFMPLPSNYLAAFPGPDHNTITFESEQAAYIGSQGDRVLLSGIAGDEVLGGVPTPIPELADLLSQLRFSEFPSRLKAWSLARKRPWTHLLVETCWNIASGRLHLMCPPSRLPALPWLNKASLKTHGEWLQDVRSRRTGNCLPSQSAFLHALSHIADQLAILPAPLAVMYETRYPYLDRSLCEFLFSIPREQLLRPTQRRSLMRRALEGIVPSEVLHRRRKAFVVRRFMTMFEGAWDTLQGIFSNSVSQQLNYVDDKLFLQALAATIHGRLFNLVPLIRTIALELWLRNLIAQELIVERADMEIRGGRAHMIGAISQSSHE